MRRRGFGAFGAAMLTLGLVAAACGGDDKSSTTASGDGGSKSGAAALDDATKSAAAASSTTAAPVVQLNTMDDYEAVWAKERAAIVARAKAEKWGVSADGKTLNGPAGFTVDLSKCVSWSNTTGLTDTSIKVGQSIAQSGTYAEYNNIARGMSAMFDYYNQKGVFKDVNGKTRTIDYVVKDDGYDAAKTIPLVDELLDSEKVFAIWTLGSPNTLKVYDKINQRCVPHPLAMTGHAAWADPVNHPWTTGAPAASYATEAVLWGAFIEQHIAEFPAGQKIKVASLITNNDFGKLYNQSFKAFVAQSSVLKDRVEYSSELIEASAPTITDNMTTVLAKAPDVFIVMAAATACTQAVVEAAQNGLKDKAKFLFQPATCNGTTFLKKEKVGGDGSASNGWWIVNPASKDITDPSLQSDPWVVFARKLLTDKGINPDSSSILGQGFSYSWPFVQALQVAGQLDGGLNRTNLILALRSLTMTSPIHKAGVHFHIDGGKDGYYVEAGEYQQWDSAKQQYVTKSNVIDLDGKSPLCAWDQAAGACKV